MRFGTASRTVRTTAAVVTAMAAATLVASCSAEPKGGRTVTVTVPPSTAATASPTSPKATGSSSVTGTPSPTATPQATSLPGTCDSTLSEYYVEQALDNTQLGGRTAFVVGVADTTIGRLATINCRYGVTGSGSTVKSKVEIGVSLYATAAQAQARITATATDYTAHGATGTAVTVPAAGSSPAVSGTYLSGGTGTGYTLPLLVVADDRRTVAVTIDPTAVTSPPAQQAALAVARVALTRTAG